jgi:hypothetical protein
MAPLKAIPCVFEDRETEYNTWTWNSTMSNDPETYEHCFVRTLTHVKNLRSTVLHEYLQVIVERTDTQTPVRTRLIVERQTDGDRVIVGRSSWATSSSSAGFLSNLSIKSSSSSSGAEQGSLPLPLYSLKFASGKLPVAKLAEILQRTTDAGGVYDLLRGKHCFWFANIVYQSVKLAAPWEDERIWPWAMYRCYVKIIAWPWTKSRIEVSSAPIPTLCILVALLGNKRFSKPTRDRWLTGCHHKNV